MGHISQSIRLRGSIDNPAQDDIQSDHMSVYDDTEIVKEPEVSESCSRQSEHVRCVRGVKNGASGQVFHDDPAAKRHIK